MLDLGFDDVTNKENSFRLKASLFMLGTDVLIIISGMNDHIGSITLAQPYIAPLNPNIPAKHVSENKFERISSSISTLTQYHHRDDQILAEFSRKICQQLNRVVTVIGGIHVDNISKEEIVIITQMLSSLQEKIIQRFNKRLDN